MRLALNGATIMPSPLEDDIAIAAEAGFDALEVWAGKLDAHLASHSLDDLREAFACARLQPWCINSIEDITFRDADGRREVLGRLEELAHVARTVGAPAIVVVPGRRPDGYNAHESVEDATQVLRAMSDVAGDVQLAFEFLGKPGCAIPTLDLAIEVITQVDRPNIGMVLDTFHFYAGGSRLDDIARTPVEKLLVVHLNGCEHRPKHELTDAHRLYPGEGAVPIDAVLTSLRSRGFDGVASVEIFRPEYWEQDPREVARRAHEAASAALARAGYGGDA